ncbi:MAG TPA: pyridoxamine 5'-phosphate oxidase family protein [Actinopolymorphaceae bacterium]
MRDESAVARRRIVRLDTEESLRLLGSVPVGRVVFSYEAMPAIRPVNHVVDDGKVLFRTHDGTAIIPTALRQAVVAYEADELDPVGRTGWSVIVTGMAAFVTEPDRLARYRERLHSWMDGALDYVIEIDPGKVTGVRLVDD